MSSFTVHQYATFTPEGSSPMIEKFINVLMWDGKKTIARKVFADMLALLKKSGSENPVDTFTLAIENIKPRVELKAKRVGGSVYQIPMEVSPKRQQTLAIRWLLATCRKVSGKSMAQRLANEVLAASKNEGASVKKREDVQRMAEANKAYAHLARY